MAAAAAPVRRQAAAVAKLVAKLVAKATGAAVTKLVRRETAPVAQLAVTKLAEVMSREDAPKFAGTKLAAASSSPVPKSIDGASTIARLRVQLHELCASELQCVPVSSALHGLLCLLLFLPPL